MRTLGVLVMCLCTLPLNGGAPAPSGGAPGVPVAGREEQVAPAAQPRDHEWLKALVGEWTTTWRLYMQPDQPPVESAGTDSVRAVGDYWVVAEARSTMMGVVFNGIMSLGYDDEREGFHGTWIDSFGGRLWVYRGTLNDAGDTLMLETEGPSPADPGAIVRYREAMRVTGPDSRTFTSTYEGEHDTWVKLVEVEFQRKKSP